MNSAEIITVLVIVGVLGIGWVLLKTFRTMCRTVYEEGTRKDKP